MATAIEVMKYIKSQTSVYGELHLQKLVYFAQAWSLAWDGRPLFRDRIEAWKMGPVVPALRFRTGEPADESVLSPAERSTVDAVVAFYGHMTGQQLADMTHDHAPWQIAWGDTPRGGRCSNAITHDAMLQYYSEQALRDEAKVPVRDKPLVAPASSDEVADIARANAERWSKTLSILAQ